MGQATFSVRKRIVSGTRTCHRKRMFSTSRKEFPKIRFDPHRKSSLSPFFAFFYMAQHKMNVLTYKKIEIIIRA